MNKYFAICPRGLEELLAALHRINARPLALRITRDALADVLINGTGRGAVTTPVPAKPSCPLDVA